MPNQSLSKTDFDGEVSALLRLRAHVAATLRPAVEAILKFANAYRTLHARIGPDYDRRVELRKRLGLDEYQHQRMVAIAAQSKTLTQFSRALPPAVEPLYEIARMTKDAAGEKRVRRAVERHELTPTSGIREIRTIRQSTRRTPTKARATKPAERPASLEFVIEGDEGLTSEVIEQFKAELVALVEKYGLSLRTKDRAQSHTTQPQPSDGHAEERARLARIFSVPALNRVISDEDFAKLPAEPRAELERELLECYERHRAAWTISLDPSDDRSVEEYIEKKVNDVEGAEVRAFGREVLEIAARHGVPRAIATLKGEMSPEAKKATATAKAMLKRERAERGESERVPKGSRAVTDRQRK